MDRDETNGMDPPKPWSGGPRPCPSPPRRQTSAPMRPTVATWRMVAGGRLAVRATSPTSHVVVKKGAEHEEVRLDVDESLVHRVTRRGETATATILHGSATFHVPPRFCSVDVSTCGGDVHVEAVVEADLHVDSRGGEVHVGQARGMRAHVRSDGGNVSLGELAAHVDVWTGRGHVQARKVLGPQVQIATVEGHVDVGAIYGETVRITSETGDVKVSQLSAEDGLVETGRGTVDVRGVQGCLHVSTQGKPIRLYLHDQARFVQATSQGGSITCMVPRGIQAKVIMQGKNRTISPTLNFASLNEEHGVLTGVLGDARRPEESTTVNTIELYAGEGKIELEESSWMEQILGRQAWSAINASPA